MAVHDVCGMRAKARDEPSIFRCFPGCFVGPSLSLRPGIPQLGGEVLKMCMPSSKRRRRKQKKEVGEIAQ